MSRGVRLLALAVVGGVVGASAACGAPTTPGPSGGSGVTRASASGLDLAGMDRAVRPADDLYGFANGGWLRSVRIPGGGSGTGSFALVAGRVSVAQRALVEDAERASRAGDAAMDPDARKIGELYASFMDSSRLNQLGATPLQPVLAQVDRLAGPDDLVRYFATMRPLGASGPITLSVAHDGQDARARIARVDQGGLSLPDRDFYLSSLPSMATVRDRFREFVAKMFGLAGVADPDGGATRVVDLETKLAAAQWSRVRNREAVADYDTLRIRHKFTVPAASAATGLAWPAYLSAAGINRPDLLIGQPSYFGALATLLTSVPLEDWKLYLKWRLIWAYAGFLSSAFDDAVLNFDTVLTGQQQPRARWLRGVNMVYKSMGQALGRMYVAKHFTPDTRQRAQALVTGILATYRTEIDKVDWMSPATRAAAEAKLDKLVVDIGYPNTWPDYASLEIRPDDLLGNIQRTAGYNYRNMISTLGEPADRDEWADLPETVNARYLRSVNAIELPAAIWQPPFFDPHADDAVNYGAVGAIVAHEISHAFDDEGRRFDGDGNTRNWWTPADAATFSVKTRALVTQFSGYRPLPDTPINGALTLGENIADLAGLTIAHQAYRAAARTPAPPLDGFTGEQRFFLSYAQMRRSVQTPEQLRDSLAIDEHSPDRFRVDGVVTNVDDFYPAFNVQPGDKLYKPPPERIHIW